MKNTKENKRDQEYATSVFLSEIIQDYSNIVSIERISYREFQIATVANQRFNVTVKKTK